VPNSQAAKRRSPLLWLFVSLRGRSSRQIYWLAYFMLLCINAALIGQLFGGHEASFSRFAEEIGTFVILATLYMNLAISVKRLHDMGYVGFFAIALFVPLVNFAFTIWIGLVPGTAGPNRYGAVTDRPPA
jgi:uncharacterized membrane protein YhaH (DUF805 family)